MTKRVVELYLPQPFSFLMYDINTVRKQLTEYIIKGDFTMSRIEERINRELREQLITVNTQNIGKGELKGIVRRLADNFHSCDTLPGMKFYGKLNPNNVPSDIRVYFVYTPTYLACATMMIAVCRYPEWLNIRKIKETLHDGLTACTGREFMGSGYDNTAGFLDAMDIFAQGQVNTFISMFPEFNSVFSAAIRKAINHLETNICSGIIRDAWSGENYADTGKFILARLKAVQPNETVLFVYGSLMKGQSAHELIKDSVCRGKYALKDYAMFDLGAYPGIKERNGETVVGEVYVINKNLIPELDRYESEGSLFVRKQLEVVSDKEKITANAYVYLGSVEHKPMKNEMWGVKDNDTIWYACYGSNLSEERFDCYIKGGTCSLNSKTYPGCDDKTHWGRPEYAVVQGEMYFGNSSPSWNQKGVAFFDPDAEGRTYMKLYPIKRSQLMDIQKQEGSSANWYGRILCLGIRNDRPVYTLTSKTRRFLNLPDKKYLTLIATQLRRCFALDDDETISYVMGLITASSAK